MRAVMVGLLHYAGTVAARVLAMTSPVVVLMADQEHPLREVSFGVLPLLLLMPMFGVEKSHKPLIRRFLWRVPNQPRYPFRWIRQP